MRFCPHPLLRWMHRPFGHGPRFRRLGQFDRGPVVNDFVDNDVVEPSLLVNAAADDKETDAQPEVHLRPSHFTYRAALPVQLTANSHYTPGRRKFRNLKVAGSSSARQLKTPFYSNGIDGCSFYRLYTIALP